MFKCAASDFLKRELSGPALARLHSSAKQDFRVLPFLPVIEKEVAGRDAITVDENKVAGPGGPNGVVEHDVLAPSAVFMPEVHKWERNLRRQLLNELSHLWPGAIIGNDDFKVGERLTFAGGKDEAKEFRFIVDGDDEGKAGNYSH